MLALVLVPGSLDTENAVDSDCGNGRSRGETLRVGTMRGLAGVAVLLFGKVFYAHK